MTDYDTTVLCMHFPCLLDEKMKDLLSKALEHGDNLHNLQSILKNYESGVVKILHGEKYFCMVEIYKSGSGRNIMDIVILAGYDMNEWLIPLLTQVKDMAQKNNVQKMYVHGRKGWLKRLQRYGFSYSYSSLSVSPIDLAIP